MSTRFHSKFHRHNHHTDPSTDPRFPDSAYDPIASPESPFLGAFVLSGSLIATSPLSSYTAYFSNPNYAALILEGKTIALSATGDTIVQNITCENIVINKRFTVFSSIVFENDVGIKENLFLSGNFIANKDSYLGSTLFVNSTSNRVGINNSIPNHALTVVGSISSTNNIVLDDSLYVGTQFSVTPSQTVVNNFLNLQNSANITNNLYLSGTLDVRKEARLYETLIVGSPVVPHLIVNSVNSRVGIRTSTPPVELTVNGEISATRSAYIGENLSVNHNTLFTQASSRRVGINTRVPNKDLTVNGEVSSTSFVYLGNSTLFIDASTNRIGINTLQPNVDLTVRGQISATNNVVFDTSLTAGNTFFVNHSNKRVGINTINPNHTLTVVGVISATDSISAPTVSLSTLSLHPSSLLLTGLVTTYPTVTASNDFLVFSINGKQRALRLWDF